MPASFLALHTSWFVQTILVYLALCTCSGSASEVPVNPYINATIFITQYRNYQCTKHSGSNWWIVRENRDTDMSYVDMNTANSFRDEEVDAVAVGSNTQAGIGNIYHVLAQVK